MKTIAFALPAIFLAASVSTALAQLPLLPGLPTMPGAAPIPSPVIPTPSLSTQLRVGNQTFTQTPTGPGPTYQTQGNTTIGSDGTLFQSNGNTTFGSNGTTSQMIGNQTFQSGPNGQSRVCTTIGNVTTCN